MGYYEIPVGIRAIFWYFFCILEYRKNTKKLREYHRYLLKTHGITVLSYNYLIFKCMYVLCSSSMMSANINNSERHNSERQQ